jgi:hypothetical protein
VGTEFLASHVRLTYRALRHSGFSTLVHCQDVSAGRVLDRRLVNDEEAFLQWAQAWNGKGNCFVGRNPRRLGSLTEVAGITAFSTDIDPIRPKGSAATLVQVRSAVVLGRKLAASYPGGALFESGNGCQLLHTWPLVDAGTAFVEKSKAFKDLLVRQFRSEGLEIDHVHEPERLMKVPGTLSTKGDRKDWRVARFLDEDEVLRDGSSVLKAILSQEVSSTPSVAGVVMPTAEQMGVKSKSEAQYHMALFLKSKGMGAAQVLAAMRASPYGKAGRDDDNVRIVQKVFAGVATVQGGQVVEKEVKVYTFQEAKDEAARRKAERGDGKAPELPLGIKGLDAILWSLRRGNMATIGARTGVGKTALALHITKTVAELGRRVLFFSTEMPVDEIAERLGIAGATPKCDIRVCDLSSPSVETVQAAIGDSKPDLLVLDFIQHTAGGGGDSRNRELSEFVRKFHDLLREHDCAGLVLSQLNRVAATERPELHHLKDCGVVEEESSAVLLMQRLDNNPDLKEIPILVDVAKNRHGARGSVTMLFQPEKMTFKEVLS